MKAGLDICGENSYYRATERSKDKHHSLLTQFVSHFCFHMPAERVVLFEFIYIFLLFKIKNTIGFFHENLSLQS